MNTLCLTEGCRIGTVQIPRFVLTTGKWMVLRWPIPGESELENRFFSLFQDKTGSEFAVFSKAGIATSFESLVKLNRTPPENIEQLCVKLSNGDQAFLMKSIKEAGLPLDTPLNNMPGTIRRLAELTLASSSAGFIVFNIGGIDPLGIQKVYEYVLEKLKQGLGVLELEFPRVGRQQWQRPTEVEILDCYLID